jgi:CCDC81-like prokaryotic HU domain 1/CCDC81-like prokaryotic HU domain 2/SPOR domain
MNLDLSPHIYTLLFQQDTVIFPDFGGLVGTYSPATIDYVQGIIYPPSKTLVLNERLTTNDGVLEHFVRNKFELTGEEARQVIHNYIEGMKATLDRGEIVLLPKVGRLYKNYERKILFLQENTNFNKDSYGLPPIQFYPIFRTTEKEQLIEAAAPILQKKMVGRDRSITKWTQPVIPIMIGCAVVTIAISLYLISPAGKERVIAGALPTLPVSETARVNRKPEIEHADIGSIFRKEEDRHSVVKQEEEPIIIPSKETETPVETEAITYAPATKSCIIILGAFSKKEGVADTVEKVIDLGYDVYQDKVKNLTRVGVQMAYEDEDDIEKALKQIRKEITSKAWVFKQ